MTVFEKTLREDLWNDCESGIGEPCHGKSWMIVRMVKGEAHSEKKIWNDYESGMGEPHSGKKIWNDCESDMG